MVGGGVEVGGCLLTKPEVGEGGGQFVGGYLQLMWRGEYLQLIGGQGGRGVPAAGVGVTCS